MGPPAAASGATWPTISPRVAPLKRPSVISATCSPRPWPTSAAVTPEHLPHARAAAGALVADDHHVARADASSPDRGEGVLLALEHPRRAPVVRPLVAGHLHHAALGREVPVEDDQASGRAHRLGQRAHHLLPRCLARARGMIGPAAAVRGEGFPVELSGFDETLHQERHAAGPIKVHRHVPPAGLQIGQQRRASAHPVEVVDRRAGCAPRGRAPGGAAPRWWSRRWRPPRRSRSRTRPRVRRWSGRRSSRSSLTASAPAARVASSLRGSSAGMVA